MADPLDTVSAAVERLIDSLEQSSEVYAFGGAIALAAWSEPRATADVDVVVWVRNDDFERAIDIAEAAGVSLHRAAALAGARDRGMFTGALGAIRVDLFVPSIPFYDEAERRRVRTTILGKPAWIHSAEVLAVFKMLFFRPKDLADVQRMLEVQTTSFDREFVRRALVDMLEDDPRLAEWDAICQRADAR